MKRTFFWRKSWAFPLLDQIPLYLVKIKNLGGTIPEPIPVIALN
jgi:hypothetical protein